jgi:hypothetical protein
MTNEELYKKFPVKYSRDGDKRKIIEIVTGIRKLIDDNKSDNCIADYIDGEFLIVEMYRMENETLPWWKKILRKLGL